MAEAPRKGFRFAGHLRSERRPLLLELGSEELAGGDESVLVAQRCIDWDSSGKKPNINVRVEVGPAAERFRLGDIIAALPALAADMGGFSKLGLERVNWVAGNNKLGSPRTDTIRLVSAAKEEHVQLLLNWLHGQPVPAHGRKRSAEEQGVGLPELVAAAQASELAGSPPKRLRADDEQAAPVGRPTQEPEVAAKMVPETARLEGLPAAVKHEVEQLVKIEAQRVFQRLISRTDSSKELPVAAAAAVAEEAADGEKQQPEARQQPGPAAEPVGVSQQPGSRCANAFASSGGGNEEAEHLRTKLAAAEQYIADLEAALSKSAAAQDKAEQETAKRIRADFPEQLKRQMKAVPAEQQQHVAFFMKLSIGALDKLVNLYV